MFGWQFTYEPTIAHLRQTEIHLWLCRSGIMRVFWSSSRVLSWYGYILIFPVPLAVLHSSECSTTASVE